MLKPLGVLIGLLCASSFTGRAEVLIVADEFPAMEVLAQRLKGEEGIASKLLYFMPGHTSRDFEDPVYGRIVVNAITVPLSP